MHPLHAGFGEGMIATIPINYRDNFKTARPLGTSEGGKLMFEITLKRVVRSVIIINLFFGLPLLSRAAENSDPAAAKKGFDREI